MIERFVFLKLAEGADGAPIVDAALSMLPSIPQVRAVRGGVPADADAEVWDVCLVVGFEAVSDVAPYLVHPIHDRFLADHVAPVVVVKKAWNMRIR